MLPVPTGPLPPDDGTIREAIRSARLARVGLSEAGGCSWRSDRACSDRPEVARLEVARATPPSEGPHNGGPRFWGSRKFARKPMLMTSNSKGGHSQCLL